MDLVGERHAQDRVVVHRREMTQVAALVLDPPSGGSLEHRTPAAVFDRMVEHGRDRPVLIAPRKS